MSRHVARGVAAVVESAYLVSTSETDHLWVDCADLDEALYQVGKLTGDTFLEVPVAKRFDRRRGRVALVL